MVYGFLEELAKVVEVYLVVILFFLYNIRYGKVILDLNKCGNVIVLRVGR